MFYIAYCPRSEAVIQIANLTARLFLRSAIALRTYEYSFKPNSRILDNTLRFLRILRANSIHT